MLFQYSKGYGWTKLWIVLKDFVLYELRAAGDNLASKDTPILGYQIEPEYILNVCTYSLRCKVSTAVEFSGKELRADRYLQMDEL